MTRNINMKFIYNSSVSVSCKQYKKCKEIHIIWVDMCSICLYTVHIADRRQ